MAGSTASELFCVRAIAESLDWALTWQKHDYVANWKSTGKIKVGSKEIEECHQFCYLGSIITNDGGCHREILVRMGKANSTFGRLGRIWASRKISVRVKIQLYNSLVLAVLLYGAETWPITKLKTRKLEAEHHRGAGRSCTFRGKIK